MLSAVDGSRKRRHDRPPTDAQRDERVRADLDPDDILRVILGVEPEKDDDAESA